MSSGEGNWRKSSEKPLELGLYSNKVTIEACSARYIICPFQLNDSMLFKVNLPNGATITLNLFESLFITPGNHYLLSAVIIASPFLEVPYKWHLFCLASFTEYSVFVFFLVCFVLLRFAHVLAHIFDSSLFISKRYSYLDCVLSSDRNPWERLGCKR